MVANVGDEDDRTDPAICVCDACIEAARVAEIWKRQRLTNVMTCVNLRGEVTVFIARETGRIDEPTETLQGTGKTQLDAMLAAFKGTA
jgi:hypothetical protein